MTQLSKLILLIITFGWTQLLSGQEKRSDQQLNDYLQQLKATRVDTVITIKSGCTGCEVKYNDISKAVADGQSIYVLTQHNGEFKVAIFDDVRVSKFIKADTCSLFEFVNKNKSFLHGKAIFYKKQIPKIISKNGFYPPSPIHYSYEELNIHLTDFHYDFKVVDNDKDHFGLKRDKEKWFILTKEIIKMAFNYSQSVKG